MRITWSAIFLAIIAFPALAFYASSRISPYFHRPFQRNQLLLQFTLYTLGVTTLNGFIIWLWNSCPALPSISLGRVISWLEQPPAIEVVDNHVPFIVFYLLLAFGFGFCAGAIGRLLILQAYARGLFPSMVRPHRELAFRVESWANESLSDEYRGVICHVLSDVLDGDTQIVYRGTLYDTEPSSRGGLGAVALWEPEKLLLDTRTGALQEAGVFERYAASAELDSELILSIPETNIRNILYEFVEIPDDILEDEEPEPIEPS